MTFEVVNWWAVIVATVVSFFVGWIWYGPLFGKTWMKLTNFKATKKSKEGMGGKMLLNFIGALITTSVLAMLLNFTGIASVVEGLRLVFWVWLGFLASTTLLGGVLWKNEPWGLFVLNGAYWLVNFTIMVSILLSWG
jgi:hypothetical protein